MSSVTFNLSSIFILAFTLSSPLFLAPTARANQQTCIASLENKTLAIPGGIVIQRIAPVREDHNNMLKTTDARLPVQPKSEFADRLQLLKTFHQSGIFMDEKFGDLLKKTLGGYAKMIQTSENAPDPSGNIPYEDLAKALLKELTNQYLSPSFSSQKARVFLNSLNRDHFDPSNINSFNQRNNYSNENDFTHKATVLANALVDFGEENLVITLKEMLMHGMGRVIKYHQEMRTATAKYEERKRRSSVAVASETKKDAQQRVDAGGVLGLATLVGGIFAWNWWGPIGAGSEFIAGLLITLGLPHIDLITFALSEKLAQNEISTIQASYQNQIRIRIEQHLRNSSKEKKSSWLKWFRNREGQDELTELENARTDVGPVESLKVDLQNFQTILSDIERSLKDLSDRHTNVLNLGALEQATLKAHSLTAMTLMILENDLDFGVLANLQTVSARLANAKDQEDLRILTSASEKLLLQTQIELDAIETLQLNLMNLRSLTGTYSSIISNNIDKSQTMSLLEPLESSMEALDDSVRSITTAKQNLIYLKIALTNLGSIRMNQNTKLLSEKMIKAHEALRNSLPTIQICTTGAVEQCMLTDKR